MRGDQNFNVGDHVRISKDNNILVEDYIPNQ